MSVRKIKKTEKPSAWLIALGRELRVEYEAVMRTSPLSPRLAALVHELESSVQPSRQQRSGVGETRA